MLESDRRIRHDSLSDLHARWMGLFTIVCLVPCYILVCRPLFVVIADVQFTHIAIGAASSATLFVTGTIFFRSKERLFADVA